MEKKVAMVTGAGTGVGKGIALSLADEGYTLVIHYNSSAAGAEAVCREIRQKGGEAAAIQANLADPHGYQKLFEEFDKLFHRLDVFVYNYGVNYHVPILELEEDKFDELAMVNWRSAYFCIQQAANRMRDFGNGGNIIAITSAHQEKVGSASYGSLKATLARMIQNTALEYAKYNIRANTLAPGLTRNGAERQSNGKLEQMAEEVPLKRCAEPDEMGAAVVFFCSDACDCVTGATLMADGGDVLLSQRKEEYGL